MASTTLAQYRTRVSAKLGLQIGAGDDQTLIDSWLNEAYEDIVLKTHCKQRRATMALTSGTYDYTLPTQAMAILEVQNTASSIDYGMVRVDLEEMMRMRRATGTPPAYFYYSEGDLITVYPTPGSGETMTVYYVPRPTALSASSDAPTDIPGEYHKLLEWYALAEGAEYDNHQPSSFGLTWRTFYENGLREMRRLLKMRGGTRIAPAQVRAKRVVIHDRSQDVQGW